MFHDTMHCTLLDFCSTEMKPWYFFFLHLVSSFYILNYCIKFFLTRFLRDFKIISWLFLVYEMKRKFFLFFYYKDKLRCGGDSCYLIKVFNFFIAFPFYLMNFSSSFLPCMSKLQWDNGNWNIKIWENVARLIANICILQ